MVLEVGLGFWGRVIRGRGISGGVVRGREVGGWGVSGKKISGREILNGGVGVGLFGARRPLTFLRVLGSVRVEDAGVDVKVVEVEVEVVN